MELYIGGYLVIGDYTPEYLNLGRGGPSDTPPEPAQFDILEVLDHEYDDRIGELTPDQLADLEREVIKQCRGMR